MNERDFGQRLQAIAPDMRLLFHPSRKRWGIYQIRHSTLLLPNDVNPERPWLLYECTDDDGGFRLPDQRDLQKAAYSSNSGRAMWKMGGEKYMNVIESQEKARAAKVRADRNDEIKEMAKVMRPIIAGTKTFRIES